MKAIASNGMEIQTGEAVLVRNSRNGAWVYCNFSHVDKSEERKYVTSYVACKYCIPYKGNEDLVGTTKGFTKVPKFKFGAKVMAYNGMEVENKIGVLIDQDLDDSLYKYKVAFQINDNEGRTDWFTKIEYLE